MAFFKTVTLALGLAGLSQAYNLNVASSGGNSSSPLAYGVMFEDINHSGDGGLYAELIQNRAFQLPDPSYASVNPWTAVGGAALAIDSSMPLSALPNSVKVTPAGTSGWAGLSNPGWWGIEVKSQKYTGEFYVRGTYNGPVRINLTSTTTGQSFSFKTIHVTSTSGNWTHYTYTLHPGHKASDVNNVLSLSFDSSKSTDGSLNFNFISLFPPTYKNRANGMRVDLMEALAELSPSYNRIPGGNNLEGNGPQFIWNETIGPQIDRKGRQGTWGYFNTEGLGLAEYLNWCVDLNMSPLWAVWDGHWLNGSIVPEADLQPYIDDTLNQLEYIMGDPTTTYWGRIRAEHGYPEGWNINYVEIGNEDNLSNGEPSYVNYRFEAFSNAILAVYPHITIVASALDIVPLGQAGDFHTYSRPDSFVLDQFNYFDNMASDRNYFVGEYATVQFNAPPFGSNTNWSAPLNRYPFWEGSIAEAVFLIGLERNTDKVIGASYAPTMANNNSIQWGTDMIYFTANTSATVRSTSHRVLSLLGGTRHTEVLPVTSDTDIGPLYYVAGQNTDTGSHIAKFATYNATNDVPVTITFEGVAAGTKANLTWLSAPDAFSHAWEGYDPVVGQTKIITANSAGAFEFFLPNYVVAVLATQSTYGGYGAGADTQFAGFGGYTGCKNGKASSVSRTQAKAAGVRGNGC